MSVRAMPADGEWPAEPGRAVKNGLDRHKHVDGYNGTSRSHSPTFIPSSAITSSSESDSDSVASGTVRHDETTGPVVADDDITSESDSSEVQDLDTTEQDDDDDEHSGSVDAPDENDSGSLFPPVEYMDSYLEAQLDSSSAPDFELEADDSAGEEHASEQQGPAEREEGATAYSPNPTDPKVLSVNLRNSLVPGALDATAYKFWRDESGKVVHTHGALLPEGYQPFEDPAFPWICPIRSCRQLFSEMFGLGRHFTNKHRGSCLNDNQDGTLSVVGEYAERASGNGFSATGASKPAILVSKNPTTADPSDMAQPMPSRHGLRNAAGLAKDRLKSQLAKRKYKQSSARLLDVSSKMSRSVPRLPQGLATNPKLQTKLAQLQQAFTAIQMPSPPGMVSSLSRPYNMWPNASGNLTILPGALLPDGYQLCSETPGRPWICPIRSCRRTYKSVQDLGYHFRLYHRGSELNDNEDGTLTVVRVDGSVTTKMAMERLPVIISKRRTPQEEDVTIAPQAPRYGGTAKTPLWDTKPNTGKPSLPGRSSKMKSPKPPVPGADEMEMWDQTQSYVGATEVTRHDPAIKDVIKLPKVRNLNMRLPLRDKFTDGSTRKIATMIVQMTGIEAPKPCTECRRGGGPFKSCVAMDPKTGPETQRIFGAGFRACANCLYRTPCNCSVKERKFELGLPGFWSFWSRKNRGAGGTDDRVAASKQVAPAAGSGGMATVARRWEAALTYFRGTDTTPKDPSVMALLCLSPLRRVEWYPGDVYSRPPFGASERTLRHVLSLLIYTVGYELPQPCTACMAGHGPYAGCIIYLKQSDLPAATMPFLRSAACSNCLFHGRSDCSAGKDAESGRLALMPGKSTKNSHRSTPTHSLGDQSANEEVPPQWASEMQGVLQAPVEREAPSMGPPASDADPERTDTDPEVAELGQSRRRAAVQGEMNRRRSTKRPKRRRKELTGPSDNVNTMEDWELDGGKVGGAEAEDDGHAFAETYFTDRRVRVSDHATLRIERMSPGATLHLGAQAKCARLCVVIQGKVRVRPQGEEEFAIGLHGIFRVGAAGECTVQNRAYVDALLHITEIKE